MVEWWNGGCRRTAEREATEKLKPPLPFPGGVELIGRLDPDRAQATEHRAPGRLDAQEYEHTSIASEYRKWNVESRKWNWTNSLFAAQDPIHDDDDDDDEREGGVG